MTTTIAPAQASMSLGGPSPAAAICRGVDLTGTAGRLEALLNEGTPDAPFAALVCHPHPLGGGTMHNKVVYHAMKVLNDPQWGFGWPVLRFNFRGAGLSQGSHAGEAESEDVLAAMDWLENEYKRPLVVAGFSFGAAMALSACCGSGTSKAAEKSLSLGRIDAERTLGAKARINSVDLLPGINPWPTARTSLFEARSDSGSMSVRALALLGLPTQADGSKYQYTFRQNCTIPKLFLSGYCDAFAPAAELAQVFSAAADPKHLALIPGADHFFTGQLEPMQYALAGWLKEQMR
jgi:alpha/beta superfamily hydrolase